MCSIRVVKCRVRVLTCMRTEGEVFLCAYQAVQSGSVVEQSAESHPGLLWREDCEREGLQAVVEGSEGVRFEEG